MSEGKRISLIVPVYYEEEVLPIAYPRMKAAMEKTGHEYEIIFVNDGSRDGTMKALRAIAAEDKRVKVLSFSRNFGHQLAVTAGMDEASGDALVIIDADLQDPPELIPDMVKLWEQGADIVYGKRQKREIDIHSLRMGNVTGIHEIYISTPTQTLTLRHEAHDRKLFAEGALDAAAFLKGKPVGLYDMETMLKETME